VVDHSATATLPYSGRTAWSRSLGGPLRDFLRTETGSAAILLGATVAALVWVNADPSSYERVWDTQIAVRVGGRGIAQSLREWVNTGLMTFFFFVVGLEVRREFDMGELRERRRFALPLFAGIGGMVVPAAIYLALNAGRDSAHGWGAAISTDTAFALGMLALIGPRFPGRLRSFMLTVVVVDDVLALLVIATVYTDEVALSALLAAVGVLCVLVAACTLGVRHGLVYVALGAALWFALYESGVEPVLTGLVMGLLASAYPPSRADLERASSLFRLFREQPTPDLARSARVGLEAAISPNERLERLFHPWTSYVIVPLFALANAGIAIDAGFLSRAFTSPITLGILIGYVVGKPVGIIGASWLTTRLSRGRLRPPVGWAAVAASGAVAGIGFTVSLLIATLAFHGEQLDEAKLGVLSAAFVASAATWIVFRATDRLPRRLRLRALVGGSDVIVDLATPVDPERDHVRGPGGAPVTLVEYGDFECPYCGQAEQAIRELLADFGDVDYVWRQLPLVDVHPWAQLAAEASEAAAAQGAFWEMHDVLLEHQDALRPGDLIRYAEQLGLDRERFAEGLRKHAYAPRVSEDVDSADLSGVSGTPTFFVNGRRHYGAYDIETLSAAVRAARARAALRSPSASRIGKET
jgi:Na+/H+ antiporter NhaA